ncbi:MAG: hypothetical protein PHW25_06180 [Zoogloea sp.]|uniref:hypothetical protein n=1 Tax=Zoogloea sp. TaxID=49181 RepID=UPI002626D193|nr:hypothetical protein [Zoogloea sp.]MDD3326654.1 hypothetical protein [Zoogloea sp.]
MGVIIDPSVEVLNQLVRRQLGSLFLFDSSDEPVLASSMDEALKRVENCFSYSKNKYYRKEGNVFFSAYHSGQYSIFLYFLARQVFLDSPGARSLADRLYYLNKALNGFDLYYEVTMPDVFYLDHPVGSVMGRAIYGEHFSFSQQCTVGNNKGVYPTIGVNVKMLSGSKILGGCNVGDNVIISANAYVKDQDVPANSLVFGSSPNLVFKSRT